MEPRADLLHQFGNQLVVLDLLSALHDPDDAGLDLEPSILFHLLGRRSSFGLTLAVSGADLSDHDPV